MKRMFRSSEEDYCPPPKQAKGEVHKRGVHQNHHLACSVCVESESLQFDGGRNGFLNRVNTKNTNMVHNSETLKVTAATVVIVINTALTVVHGAEDPGPICLGLNEIVSSLEEVMSQFSV